MAQQFNLSMENIFLIFRCAKKGRRRWILMQAIVACLGLIVAY
jgi:hypothetical protein